MLLKRKIEHLVRLSYHFSLVTITRQIQTNNVTLLEENNLEMSAWNEPITWQWRGVWRADQEQKWRHLLYRRVAACSLRQSIL
jgi:predicted double-glycine peptidase